MPLAYIRPAGEHNLYHIHYVDGDHRPVDPGFGQGRPSRPDNSLPGYGHPDQGLPGHGHPDQGLPGHQPRPDHGLPGGIPGVPDNSLPTTPPPQVAPGQVVIMIRTADGKWKWASMPAANLPTPLPVPPTGAQPKG